VGQQMASTSKIQERIAEIVGRPNSVKFGEIKWVMDQIGAKGRRCKHGWLYSLNGKRVMINEHNNGKDTVPQYSVDEFMEFMIELGLYP
jgi:hypothetical protein